MLVNIIEEDKFGDLEAEFNRIDIDKDGKIGFEDLKKAFKKSELKFSDYELKTIFTNVAFENEEYINYKEFLMATIKPEYLMEDDLILSLFRKFDVLNISSIDEEDISRYLNR